MICRKWILVIVVLFSMAMLNGCGGLSGDSATLVIVNNTTTRVFDELYVYDQGASASEMGSDLIITPIESGQSDSFTISTGGLSLSCTDNTTDPSNYIVFGDNFVVSAGGTYTATFIQSDGTEIPK